MGADIHEVLSTLLLLVALFFHDEVAFEAERSVTVSITICPIEQQTSTVRRREQIRARIELLQLPVIVLVSLQILLILVSRVLMVHLVPVSGVSTATPSRQRPRTTGCRAALPSRQRPIRTLSRQIPQIDQTSHH